MRCTNAAGSSSVLSIRLAASSPSSSTRSITNTRRRDSNGVLLAAAITGPSMSETSISWAPLGTTQVRSGCAPDMHARAGAVGVRRPLREQLGRQAARPLACRRRRPVEQVGVRRLRRRRAPGQGRHAHGDVDRARRAPSAIVARDNVRAEHPMARGRLITIEGIDGAGKTTLARGLLAPLQARGIEVRVLREPGGVRAAELIRGLVKDPELRDRRPRRSPAVRRRARAARRGGTRTVARRGGVGGARPFRGLVARLPGRRPRAGNRARPRDQRVRHRLAGSRPDAAAELDPGLDARGPPNAPRLSIGSSSSTTSSLSGSPPPTPSWPRRNPSGSGRSTPPSRPRSCSQPRWPRSTT